MMNDESFRSSFIVPRSSFVLRATMLNNNCGSEASENVVVLAIATATVVAILYAIYTTLGGKLTDLLNHL